MWSEVVNSPTFQELAIPAFIFFARVVDVSMGTIRMVAVSRGQKKMAAFLGFFEVLIWLTAISFILQNLTTITNYFAYAGGFAAGNYLGLKIEEKMAHGLLGITVITNNDARNLIDHLKKKKFGLTSVSATGATGKVRVIFSVIRRRHLEDLRKIVQRFQPNAFMTVQDVRSSSRSVYPFHEEQRRSFGWLRIRK